MAEIERALTDEGRLVIQESYSPLDYSRLQDLFEGTGFYVVKIWDKRYDPKGFEKQRRMFTGPTDTSDREAYIIELRKRNESQQ